MKILVIGGAGFIGCNIADYYLKKKENVAIFDNFSRKGAFKNIEWLKRIKSRKFKVVRGDIRFDIEKLERLINDSDVVFHMAAQVAVTTSVKDPRDDFETNALGTFNILESVRKSRRKPILVYASTNKVYGKLGDVVIKESGDRYYFKNLSLGVPESMPLDFYSPYGCSKGSADQYVRDYSRIYGLRTVVFRQSCIYGLRQFGVEDQGWVAHFIIATVLKRPLTVYGNGKQVRDILFIDDLVNAFNMAISNIKVTSGEIYNIGGGPDNQISILQLVKILEAKFKNKILLSFSENRPGDQNIYVSDISKAMNDFGWEPGVTVDKGISRLIKWVQENKELF
jgi:CDP-paratose 2-epimerase